MIIGTSGKNRALSGIKVRNPCVSKAFRSEGVTARAAITISRVSRLSDTADTDAEVFRDAVRALVATLPAEVRTQLDQG